MPLDSTVQAASPFFRLPAEIRIAVYEHLDFPPVENWQCRGFILSCRRAKRECEDVATILAKECLRVYERNVLPNCTLGVRILLPLPTRTPVERHTTFHTLRHLTLVLSGHAMLGFLELHATSFQNLRPLNAIFSLWLDSLTLHFCGPLNQRGVRWPMKRQMKPRVKRLVYVLESGFRQAHQSIGQGYELSVKKHGSLVDCWQPEPVFIKRLVVSWDLTERGLRSEDLIEVEGQCNKRPTVECAGKRGHYVSGKEGLLGEFSRDSTSRFRGLEIEEPLAKPSSEHEKTCLNCRGREWDYRRYIRGLPTENDERWL